MKISALKEQILRKKTFLCVGLDSDIKKLPNSVRSADDPVFEFNKAVIDATQAYAVAFKPNTAFYEQLGAKGWDSLQRTAEYIKTNYPELFLIADAKRGDIGNTSKMYARTFFEQMPFDAVTVAPYMGHDSVTPFLEFNNKHVILLALTSNPGASDFQLKTLPGSGMLYEEVLRVSKHWGNENALMYVTGATKAEKLETIRRHIPKHFLLVPGIGAQGGDLKSVIQNGLTPDGGLLINSSRGIIFADDSKNFANSAAKQAQKLQTQMAEIAGVFFENTL
ncbi:MAG: orotidine-5'-phosphate decarboxylase [Bacteroidota bacterium]|nr:orotidine-5'-phosphate decarboxylase [Bacteroidota bacterium]